MDDNDSHISDGLILERWEWKVDESLARGNPMFMGPCPEVRAHPCGFGGGESVAEAGGNVMRIADNWVRISLQIQ